MTCDIEPDFYTETRVRAHKVHRCCECRQPIMQGEQHWSMTGKWDGRVETQRQHQDCYAFARKLNGVEPYDPKRYGDCIPFGSIGECIAEMHNPGDPWPSSGGRYAKGTR